MNPTGIDIQIRTEANTAGAKAAADALGQVTTQATKGAAAAQVQGKAVNELGESFDKGAAAGRVLGEVARGNVLALGQLGAALKALGAVLRTNLIGGLITLGALAATVLLPLIKGFQDKKKAVDQTGEAIDANRRKMEELAAANKEAIDRIVADAKLATAAYAELAGMIDSARRRQDELADAALAAKLAEIDAAEQFALANAGTDEDRSLIRTRFARERADARSRSEENRLANDLLQAGILEDQARAAQERAREVIRAAEAEERRAEGARDVASSQLAGARESGASEEVFEAFAADYLAAVKELEAIRARSAATREEQGALISRAQQDIDRANQTRQVGAIRARELEATRFATATSRAVEDEAARARAAASIAPQVLADTQLAAGNQFVRNQPRLQELNAAVAAAAQALMQDGATGPEADRLVSTLEAFAEALKARSLSTATIDQRLEAIESQLRSLRN